MRYMVRYALLLLSELELEEGLGSELSLDSLELLLPGQMRIGVPAVWSVFLVKRTRERRVQTGRRAMRMRVRAAGR